ncbi:hypothetical protein [Methylomonas rosea]|uniref:Uncharacterized protein n=1 Tax=Methylomonas rosea TaxID=2952227 RepID=A0ABT1TY75_9GAMM|nr:hypothetical protein [Methylomonas sp. WSC-7]MCQ8119490.1 hypothetical protein [Methylomonas sp. WSC-7]
MNRTNENLCHSNPGPGSDRSVGSQKPIEQTILACGSSIRRAASVWTRAVR